ncbi:TPA: DNA replication initiation control protein YabA [Streptococcus agalactiae]
MDKKDLFDAFDDFSQNLLVGLSEIETMKKQIQKLLEENTVLRIENGRLSVIEAETETAVKNSKQGRELLEGIYNDGFHICNTFYGQRRENDEECAFCIELLYRD